MQKFLHMLNDYRSALITGGSSGIGLMLAHQMAELNLKLILVSENMEQLTKAEASLKEKYPDGQFKILCCDLSEEREVHKMLTSIHEKGLTIDIVVNNAGFGTWGRILEVDERRERAMMNLMINGTYVITKYFLKEMVEKNHGCIVNIASIAAFQPNPTLATYGATKSWIYNWTRSISEELKNQDSMVQCIAICPTPVRTNFQQASHMSDSKLFDSPFTVDPEDVASDIIKAIRNRKVKSVPVTWLEWMQKLTLRFPESWRIWIGKQMMAEKK